MEIKNLVDYNILNLKYIINKETVLVILPTYNRRNLIIESIESIIKQDYNNILLHIIDDDSDDDTSNLILDYINKNNIKSIIFSKSKINLGAYVNINNVLKYHINDDFGFWALQGSDDISHQKRISKTINFLKQNKNLKVCRTKYVRGENDNSPKYGDSMLVCSKQVFYDIGYYDANRFGADSDYSKRVLLQYGVIGEIPETLYYAKLEKNRLTNEYKIEERKAYVEKIKIEHEHSLYRSYNNINRGSIICGIATIKHRSENLKLTVDSLINQVDKLIIYQNDYYDVFDFLNHPKIEVYSSLTTKINMGDAGKFYLVDKFQNCYYLSCDDDIIYPKNYTSEIIKNINKYNNNVIVSYHGRIMNENAKDYYKDIKEGFRCLDNVNVEKKIDFGGTGVMGFYTNLMSKLNFNYFKHENMADIWVGKFAKENNIPIFILPHNSGWIKTSLNTENQNTISKTYRKNHRAQNEILLEFNKKKRFKLIFLTCTWGRPEITKIFLKNLKYIESKTKNLFDIELFVIDSDDTNRNVFSKNDSKVKYFNFKNKPVSNKWNFGVNLLKNLDFDYVFFLGSDDILDEKLINVYYNKMLLNYDFIGITDMYFFNIKNNNLYYWGGYSKNSKRYNETIGLGRCISKSLLNKLNYEPWTNNINKGLDFSLQKKLNLIYNFKETKISLINEDCLACDIKSDLNITNINEYDKQIKLINKDNKIYNKIINLLGFNVKNVNSKLTIIIPTYKNTKYIDDCLKSIDTNSCEVLIGIDGCIETKKYFENAEQINNVKVFYFNQNLGPYSIKNTLAKIATSNNLLFFDSDDIMNPNMIDTILNGLERYVCVKPKFEEFGGKSLKGTTFGEGVFGIRKDIFLSMNGFEPWKMAADSDFMGRLYKKRVSILHTPQILFKRRVHPESLTNRKDTGMHSPLRAHYARLSKNKKGDGNPVELHTRDYIEINISNDLEVNSVPQKEKNSVLNLLNRVQQPVIVKEKKEVNYEEVNKVIYNKTQNKKPTKKGENTLMNKNLNVRKKIFNSFNNNRNLGGKI